MHLVDVARSVRFGVDVAAGVEQIQYEDPASIVWLASGSVRPATDADVATFLANSHEAWWQGLTVVRVSSALYDPGERTLIPALIKSRLTSGDALAGPLREFRLAFTTELAELGYAMDDGGPANIVVNKPGLRSTAYDYDCQRQVGLHIDDHQKLELTNRQAAYILAALNLGQRERYLHVVPVEMAELIAAIACPPDGLSRPRQIKDAYLAQVAEPCVLRITLPPGTAYLLNTQNFIHDGATPMGATPDIALLMLGNPIRNHVPE